MKLWGDLDQQQQSDTTEARRITFRQYQHLGQSKMWKQVHGPMGATIATLLGMGWQPIRPNRWVTQDVTIHACIEADDLGANEEILQAAKDRIVHITWARASRHYLGAGLDTGPPSIRHRPAARKDLLTYPHAGPTQAAALDAVMAGGATCGDRFTPTRACPICGGTKRDSLVSLVGNAQQIRTCSTSSSKHKANGSNPSWPKDGAALACGAERFSHTT